MGSILKGFYINNKPDLFLTSMTIFNELLLFIPKFLNTLKYQQLLTVYLKLFTLFLFDFSASTY